MNANRIRTIACSALFFVVNCGSGDPATSAGPGTGGAGGSAPTGGAGGRGAESGAGGTEGDSGFADSRTSDARLYIDGDVQISLPPLDPGKRVNEITSVELGTLCDWMANMLGGYDQHTECGGGISVRTHKDQAECMRGLFPVGCAITIAEFETCVIAQAPSRGCVVPGSACRAFINC